jgi:threonine aldolase
VIVDLRSDTVTTPTPEMRAAMAAAEVGDDVYGEDPTVNRLQSLAAALVGKEAALFVPSGTMANQLAIRVLTRPGTEVLCGARAHVYRSEGAGAAVNSGVQMRPVPDDAGVVAPDALTFPRSAHEGPPVSLVCLENTYMPASGRPAPAPELEACARVAHDHDAAVHLDGARLCNAAVALDTTPAALAAPADTVMFCLSKGLAAPVGSLLCGPADVIAEARAQRQRFGGAMRQAGVIAAAGVVALETMVARLADDHARAARIAAALASRWPGAVDPADVRTNIVCADARALPSGFVAQLDGRGVRAGMLDARTVRLVTHKDVDDAAVARVVAVLDEVAGARR